MRAGASAEASCLYGQNRLPALRHFPVVYPASDPPPPSPPPRPQGSVLENAELVELTEHHGCAHAFRRSLDLIETKCVFLPEGRPAAVSTAKAPRPHRRHFFVPDQFTVPYN